MEVALDDSGRISLEYGSPQGSAEFITWVLNRFPPSTTSPSNCSSEDTTPQSPPTPPSGTCSPSDPDFGPSPHHPRLQVCFPSPLMDDAATALVGIRQPRADNAGDQQ